MTQAAAGRRRLAARCSERCATMILTGLTQRFRGSGDLGLARDDRLIGEAPDRTFACPGCARSLAIGQRRCSGCGSFLVAGVLVRRALLLVLVGIVAGMIGGALIAGAAMAPRLAAADAVRAAAAVTPVTASVPAAVTPVAASVPAAPAAALPTGVVGGLLQVAVVNERLARAGTDLAAALAVPKPAAADVAPLLRKIAADAWYGEQGARRVAAWPAAGAFAAGVTVLYGAAAAIATDGLGAPLADNSSYAAAGRRMLTALGALPGLEVATRLVADRAGVALPGAAPAP